MLWLGLGGAESIAELSRAPKHTDRLSSTPSDCGMLTFQSSQLHSLVKKRTQAAHHPAIEQLAALEFDDLDKSITDDVAFLKAHPLILDETKISGWKYVVSGVPGEGERCRS